MSEEKDLQQLKKEAAERAKQLARERLAAKQAAEQAEQPSDDAKKDVTEEKTEPSADDIALAKKKASEAARAKAAELRKQKEAAAGKKDAAEAEDDIALAKKKAAEAARAKAAELRKQKEAAAGNQAVEAEDDIALAKKKAAAAAKAKAAALAKQKAKEKADGETDDELAKQKAIAAAKAKAAAAAKAAGASGETPSQQEKTPSPNQPLLDKYVKVIREHLGGDVLEDAYINRLAKDVPTLVAKKETYYKIAEFLKYNEQLGFDYLSELHGTDFQTHMEVYVHLYSYKNRQAVALKVKIDRDQPEIDSLVPLWQGANWPECEAYDLLGIRFKGHPNLTRILLGENWVGYPLRKDYEPYDVEV
ncbi:NADH-quinone oxidoreductase subunit C [Saccharococcus caldoxylosilyticus]|uniref:NAD(P)H dehydrogenase subunit J n=1 Tax=Saccharococcus caldoxylosilyticus TaxID=81408 RepID=A0A150M366_9BACL|nr:NADH-quinone oxidoreductase subunit C [Parageobacillus caldoxylosilyticus]KYD19030.1 NADH-ubiquinone oxidoreductase chain C [Parageobacillus caldoxylosilyticus]